MSVYVDDFNAQFGRMVMCHMLADTTEELLEMADKIGVQRKWIQAAGTWQEHFDISLSKKKLAIQNGAIEVGARQLAEWRASRKDSPIKHLVGKHEQIPQQQKLFDQ